MDNHFESGHEHGHTLSGELICHLPYAIFSVAFGLSILSFMSYFSTLTGSDEGLVCRGADALFHSFHFMHIIFASTGTLITYYRFSKNIIKGLVVGSLSAAVFCTLSDSVIPYIGGSLMGVDMHLHICFFTELRNVLPFLFVGLFNGYIMSRHHSSRQALFSVFSHFIHILISSFAAMFYLVS